MSNSKLSLAPMMEYTDRHFRHLVRLISSKTLLYSEMVTANAITHERMDSRHRAAGVCYEEETNRHKPAPMQSPAVQRQSRSDIDAFGYDMTILRRYIAQGHTGPHLEGPSVHRD